MGTEGWTGAGGLTGPRRGEKVSYYSAVCLETGEVEPMEPGATGSQPPPCIGWAGSHWVSPFLTALAPSDRNLTCRSSIKLGYLRAGRSTPSQMARIVSVRGAFVIVVDQVLASGTGEGRNCPPEGSAFAPGGRSEGDCLQFAWRRNGLQRSEAHLTTVTTYIPAIMVSAS